MNYLDQFYVYIGKNMSSDTAKNNRKKIALDEQTYDKLKNFSRFNGLKTRKVVDSMVELVLQDETLSRRVIDLTRQQETGSNTD